jgi:hypothetical protein
LIGELSIPEERELPTLLLDPTVRSHKLAGCFRHEGEDCPRCDGSGYRPRIHCAGCGEPAGRPGGEGRALMGLRNRRGRNQPLYCLECHPELGRGLAVLEGLGG